MIGVIVGVVLIVLGVLYFKRKAKNTIYVNSKTIGEL